MKILAVCTANTNRSPTAERIIRERYPDWEVDSAGTWGGPHILTEELLNWADLVICADLSHKKFIEEHHPTFPEDLIAVMGISDQYDREDPDLVDLIEYWLDRHIVPGRQFGRTIIPAKLAAGLTPTQIARAKWLRAREAKWAAEVEEQKARDAYDAAPPDINDSGK